MSPLQRNILIGLCIATAAAFAFLKEPEFVSQEVDDANKKVFPRLEAESIHAVVVNNRFGTLTIEKQGQYWAIQEKEGYFADTLRMNEILSALSELEIIQKTTIAPPQWDTIGVQDPSTTADPGAGCKVNLYGANGYQRSIIAGTLQASGSEAALMFGNEFDGRSFLRFADSDQVYLVGQSLSFLNTIPSHWMMNILSNAHAYKHIRYVKAGTAQWSVKRNSRAEPYQLFSGSETSGNLIPNLTTSIDYSFASMFIRDVMPQAFDRSTVAISTDHYFELEALDGFTQRIYLGGKTQAPAQERLSDEGTTGVFRKVRGDTFRYAYIDWEQERTTPIQAEPPYARRTYLVDSPQMDDFMISYDEMLVFERISPSSAN